MLKFCAQTTTVAPVFMSTEKQLTVVGQSSPTCLKLATIDGCQIKRKANIKVLRKVLGPPRVFRTASMLLNIITPKDADSICDVDGGVGPKSPLGVQMA